jgi:hypothetical protein
LALSEFESKSRFNWDSASRLGSLNVTPIRQTVNFMTYPLLVLDTARLLDLKTTAAKAVAASNWAEAEHIAAVEPHPHTWLYHLSRPTMTDGNYAFPKTVARSFFRMLTKRRMAAVALAMRLHHAEHGQFPRSLDDLSPDFPRQMVIEWRPTRESARKQG